MSDFNPNIPTGNAIDGPFQLYLDGVKEILKKEIEADGSGMESPRTGS